MRRGDVQDGGQGGGTAVHTCITPATLEARVPQSVMWGGGGARTCGRGRWTTIPGGVVTVHVCITTEAIVMRRR